MKQYGQGFWVVRDGIRIRDRRFAYPDLRPFEYSDGTGDLGWWNLSPFSFDYVPPKGSGATAWRFTVAGSPLPCKNNSFDFDGASVPQNPLVRLVTRDKMDRRWIVSAFGHDLGYCITDYVTGFTKADWDTFLTEVAEAYGENAGERGKYTAAVKLFGGKLYGKTTTELERYRSLVKIERVPV